VVFFFLHNFNSPGQRPYDLLPSGVICLHLLFTQHNYSSSLKPEIKIGWGWIPFKNRSDSHTQHPRWPALPTLISKTVYYIFVVHELAEI